MERRAVEDASVGLQTEGESWCVGWCHPWRGLRRARSGFVAHPRPETRRPLSLPTRGPDSGDARHRGLLNQTEQRLVHSTRAACDVRCGAANCRIRTRRRRLQVDASRRCAGLRGPPRRTRLPGFQHRPEIVGSNWLDPEVGRDDTTRSQHAMCVRRRMVGEALAERHLLGANHGCRVAVCGPCACGSLREHLRQRCPRPSPSTVAGYDGRRDRSTSTTPRLLDPCGVDSYHRPDRPSRGRERPWTRRSPGEKPCDMASRWPPWVRSRALSSPASPTTRAPRARRMRLRTPPARPRRRTRRASYASRQC